VGSDLDSIQFQKQKTKTKTWKLYITEDIILLYPKSLDLVFYMDYIFKIELHTEAAISNLTGKVYLIIQLNVKVKYSEKT
jgi:hypothetical protein